METQTTYDDAQKDIVLNQLIIDMGNARKYLSIDEMAQAIAVNMDDLEIDSLQKALNHITLNREQDDK
jgi:hypothetical protein